MAMHEEEYDLSEYTADGVERSDRLPVGWYRAIVTDVSQEERTGALVIKFEVTDGEHKDATVSERLWDPKKADAPDKAETSRRRRIAWAKRLRIISEADFGKPGVRFPWDDAIGKEVVINIKERKYKDKDGNPGVTTNIDFLGVYQPDDQRVPEELRGTATGGAGGVAATGTRVANNPGRSAGEAAFDGL